MLNRNLALAGLLMFVSSVAASLAAEPDNTPKKGTDPSTQPSIGKRAPDFALESVDGRTIRLSKLTEKAPVVLVVLRGYPGYQCPICNQQVGELLKNADKIAKAGAQVVLVYPGPSVQLAERAKEFIADRTIPQHFHFVIDPDYTFTKAYGLRWEAPRETAYPSTFVIDRQGVVRFAKVSKTHGGRANSEAILKALAEMPNDAKSR